MKLVQLISNDGFEMVYGFPLWWAMSMLKNWLLVSWAYATISYSLAEHTQKLVTRWISMRENWLLAGRASAKIILAHPCSPRSPVPLSFWVYQSFRAKGDIIQYDNTLCFKPKKSDYQCTFKRVYLTKVCREWQLTNLFSTMFSLIL